MKKIGNSLSTILGYLIVLGAAGVLLGTMEKLGSHLPVYAWGGTIGTIIIAVIIALSMRKKGASERAVGWVAGIFILASLTTIIGYFLGTLSPFGDMWTAYKYIYPITAIILLLVWFSDAPENKQEKTD